MTIAAPPSVSILVPCYNEQHTIALLLDAIDRQTYPRQDMEVIIADGLSTDQTRAEIARFQQTHPALSIQIVDNPKRHIPSALNRALERARGTYLVRLDAHAVPATDYVVRCVEALETGKGENVGGVWQIAPGKAGHGARLGWIARAIAVAAAHPLGVGDAHYRHATQAQYVDTVPFGAFRRSLVEKIGPFDENLLTNEDYEFNVRIRQAGGKIWLDPAIRSTYFARATLSALARQYLRYGFWKGQMLRRYPETIRWRQAIPPGFVLSLVVFALLAPFAWARGLLAAELGVYFAALLGAGLHSALKKRDPALIPGLPLAIATMHLCWGGALLWSLISFKAPRS
ncbi:MAG TPA: glycosyltransferase family 2 protein [Anaerolineales bacterium]|nr:glycosyltransferase family 2 protein [Anaerolineales bacterium]